AGSPVDIAVGATEHGTLLVEVRDHGPGLDEEPREKVFERFYRTDAPRSRAAGQRGGAGLGPSLAATLAAQDQGALGAREAPGGGSTVWVELPAAEVDSAHLSHPGQFRALPSPHTPADEPEPGAESTESTESPESAGGPGSPAP